jgi:hypothetical protein
MELKNKIGELESKLSKFTALESEVRSIMGVYQKEMQMTQMIQKLLNDNKNLKESCKSTDMTLEDVRSEYTTRQTQSEETIKKQLEEVDSKYKQIIMELQASLDSQMRMKENEL